MKKKFELKKVLGAVMAAVTVVCAAGSYNYVLTLVQYLEEMLLLMFQQVHFQVQMMVSITFMLMRFTRMAQQVR